MNNVYLPNIPNTDKLMVVCGHALEQIKVGFPVHTIQTPPVSKEDSGKIVLCELCFELGERKDWQKIPAGTICGHCFIEQLKEMMKQRNVN